FWYPLPFQLISSTTELFWLPISSFLCDERISVTLTKFFDVDKYYVTIIICQTPNFISNPNTFIY
ncbi:hypothetical protein LINPERHAP1_LOCUS34743, partial [Linum perenne]